MNQADSEVVLWVLEPAGFARAARAEDAQLVMLNMCAIREGAEAKIWSRLRALRRELAPATRVGVLGCMAERLKARLLEEERLVDLVVGPDAYRDLPRLIGAWLCGAHRGRG